MKRFEILFILIPLLLAGCHQESAISMVEDESTVETVSHDMMVLGDQLDDPYSVGNITKAMEKVYPSTKSSRTDITPTDMYIRFLPADEDEFATLEDLGLHLMDHPLDYQIVKDGDYYHDPTVPEDEITWQYAVVPKDFELPEGIRYEILDECYIPSNDEATKSDGLDWDLIEREAFILTGNEDLLVPDTKAEKTYPAGRITIVDDGTTEGTEIGVAGVKVVGNVFVKFGSGYTDRDGYYKLSKKFSSKVRYRIMFKNKEDFCIGMNLILVPASFSALGKGPSTGVDYKVTSSSDRKLFTRCVVNNAAYDYINRCSPDDLNIQVPPKHLRLWIFQKTTSSSSPMLRHGTILENQLLKKYLGNYAYLINVFLPDITIGAKNKEDYATIYSVTCHEMAHASHFAQVDVSFWNKYITYILTSFVTSGATEYGLGSGDNAGYCEIGEMWGYFMHNCLFYERYGGTFPLNGCDYWFKPQILMYLYDRGMSQGEIFKAFVADVHDKDALEKKLKSLYPEKKTLIEQVFDRYED